MIERHALLGFATVASVIVLAGCAAKEPPAAKADKEPWVVRVESPLDTIQVTTETGTTDTQVRTTAETPMMDTPTVTESAGTLTPGATSSAAVPATTTTPPEAKSFLPGWRVQIFATTVMTNAEAAAAKARQRFTEPVYVEYEAPSYKVRVGDFLSKEDARHMVNRAKSENYADAWIVEDLVVRPER